MCVALVRSACAVVLTGLLATSVAAQSSPAQSAPATPSAPKPVEVPAGYVIGPEDMLSIVFWQEKELTTDVVVRPDGKVSVPLLNDIQAAGLTPEQLAAFVSKAASKFVAEPLATVIVKQINSRKVFVLGAVGKQGPVSLTSDMTVLQLIALVEGFRSTPNARISSSCASRTDTSGATSSNYEEVIEGRKIEQNIKLEPGDTMLVFD